MRPSERQVFLASSGQQRFNFSWLETRYGGAIKHEHFTSLHFISFRFTIDEDIWVRIQNSIGIPDFDSLPEPDVAWLKKRDYSKTHPQPADVLLLIEVSDSTLNKDRDVRSRLYAEAGIQDYWIVNVREACIEVRRRPHGDRFQSLETYAVGDQVSPLVSPGVFLTVAEIVGY